MKKPSTTAFVLLPKSILKHPPIAHRGQPSAGLLTPFDMAVLAAVVALARAEGLASERHRAAMEHGEQAMQKKRAKYVEKDKKRRDHLFAEERRRFGDPIDHNIPAIGRAWYRNASRNYRRNVTTAVPITESKASLLKLAGLSLKAGNYGRLDGALARFRREPVQALPPPLQTVRRVDGGRLRLLVDPAWLPHDVGKVALPLPVKGNATTTMALFLFLAGIDTRRDSMSRGRIRADKFCRLLGIRITINRHWTRTLNRALDGVNRHLAARKQVLADAGLPIEYVMEPASDGTWIRCTAIYGKPSAQALRKRGRGLTERELFASFEDMKETEAEREDTAAERMRRHGEYLDRQDQQHKRDLEQMRRILGNRA